MYFPVNLLKQLCPMKENAQVAMGALTKCTESKLGEQQKTVKNRCSIG